MASFAENSKGILSSLQTASELQQNKCSQGVFMLSPLHSKGFLPAHPITMSNASFKSERRGLRPWLIK